VVCRTGYTGERGYELVVPAQQAAVVWTALLSAGAPFGIRACGLAARDTLRTEMGYPLHGQDVSLDVTPVQARLGWAVGWDKPAFWGREVLLAEKQAGPARTLRGLVAAGRGIARPGMRVLADDEVVGAVTSGTFSPTRRQAVALALVDSAVTLDQSVQVDVRGRRETFTVTKPPFVAAHGRLDVLGTCSGREAPMIAADTLSFCSTQAMASCASDSPASSASGLSCCTAPARRRASSARSCRRRPWSSVAREPSGGCWPGRYLPVSTPWAIGDQTIWPMPSSLAGGTTSASMTRHSIEYCGWLETSGMPSSGERVAGSDLLGGPLRDADVERLAGADEVGERLHRLLERRLVVEAVRLVEVDVVGLQPLQRAVDRLHDVLARQAAVVGPGAGRPVDLGEDLQRLAPLALERLAEHRLGLGVGVDVGGVEGGDADVERRRTQAVAWSSSTCEPCVSQLP
jgi:hypothetical protein